MLVFIDSLYPSENELLIENYLVHRSVFTYILSPKPRLR